MEEFNRKTHWEKIYQTKQVDEVSWYQPTPTTSLGIIQGLEVPKTASIIDIGGGDSFMVDHLLERGFQDVTVLDISEAAIQRAQQRLGAKAEAVHWIVADAATFRPERQYDLWHDRAAFHFLTKEEEIASNVEAARQGLKPGGLLVVGTFSEQGPKKCSGIEIQQYSLATLAARFGKHFTKIECITTQHETPFKTVQDFVFCSFRRKEAQ